MDLNTFEPTFLIQIEGQALWVRPWRVRDRIAFRRPVL